MGLLYPAWFFLFGFNAGLYLFLTLWLLYKQHKYLKKTEYLSSGFEGKLVRLIEQKNPHLQGYLSMYWEMVSSPEKLKSKTSYFYSQILAELNKKIPKIALPSLSAFINTRILKERALLLFIIYIGLFWLQRDYFMIPFAKSLDQARKQVNIFYPSEIEVPITEIEVIPPLYTKRPTRKVNLQKLKGNKKLTIYKGSKVKIELKGRASGQSDMNWAVVYHPQVGQKMIYPFSKGNEKDQISSKGSREDSQSGAPQPGAPQPAATLFIMEPGDMVFNQFYQRKIAGHGVQKIKVELLTDQKPTVSLQVLNPKRVYSDRDVVILQTKLQDDFGLSSIQLVYQINEGPIAREKIRAFTIIHRKRYEERYRWQLANLVLKTGDAIRFWIEAVDNDIINGPHIGVSNQLEIKINDAYSKHQEIFDSLRKLKLKLVNNLADLLTLEHLKLPIVHFMRNTGEITRELNQVAGTMYSNPLVDKLLLTKLRDGISTLRNYYIASIAALRAKKRAEVFKGIEVQEDLIYLIHDIIQNQEISNILNRSEDFFSAFQKLESLIAEYRKTGDQSLKDKIKQAMQDLKAFLSEMQAAMSKKYAEMSLLSPNQDAMKRMQQNNMSDLLNKLENSLDSDNLDQIEQELSQLMDQYSKKVRDINQSMSRMQQQKYSQVFEKFQEVLEQTKEAEQIEKSVAKQISENMSGADQGESAWQKHISQQQKVDHLMERVNKGIESLQGTIMQANQLKEGK